MTSDIIVEGAGNIVVRNSVVPTVSGGPGYIIDDGNFVGAIIVVGEDEHHPHTGHGNRCWENFLIL